MAYLLFVDESGQDQGASPYEVLAGVAIRDSDLWPLIEEVVRLELDHFGVRYSRGDRELKAKKILKTKTFRQSQWHPPFTPDERRELARECLANGEQATGPMMAALGQAKVAFAEAVLQACAESRVRVFASMVPRTAPRSKMPGLRKDYAYLFERFSYFLEDDAGGDQLGIVVFDELERSRSHLLVDQMSEYFRRTLKGRRRAAWIIPEPFFVHSDLTTGIQLADLVAYVLSWNFRIAGRADLPARRELDPLGRIVSEMRYRAHAGHGRPARLRHLEHRHHRRPSDTARARTPQIEKAMPAMPAKPPLQTLQDDRPASTRGAPI
ncbi:MAG TPA: DUF3800 domain-containing protein [Iamia sp.]|nr:DUF3800 domain-containing protein [Iamia sp.]